MSDIQSSNTTEVRELFPDIVPKDNAVRVLAYDLEEVFISDLPEPRITYQPSITPTTTKPTPKSPPPMWPPIRGTIYARRNADQQCNRLRDASKRVRRMVKWHPFNRTSCAQAMREPSVDIPLELMQLMESMKYRLERGSIDDLNSIDGL